MKVRVSPKSALRSVRAFSLVEIMITVGLSVLAVGVLMIFWEASGRTLLSITTQSSSNQSVGNAIEYMFSRIRLSNTASNDSTGNVLTLTFDDNPDADSDGDGTTWNDMDHAEQFLYKSIDASFTSLDDNYIGYKATLTGTTNVLIPSYVRKLSGTNIFLVRSNVVYINFGLLTTNATPFSQAIEIRTKVARRNKTS